MKNIAFDRKNIIRLIIFAFAAFACIYGACRGEAEAVLRKASQLCLECCGIG